MQQSAFFFHCFQMFVDEIPDIKLIHIGWYCMSVNFNRFAIDSDTQIHSHTHTKKLMILFFLL